VKTSILYGATALIFLFGISAASVCLRHSPETVFRQNFRPYELPILRGSSNYSALRTAYGKGKMDSVIWDFKNLSAPVPEEYLLTGIAFLEKNEPEKAIETFQTLIQKNSNSNTDFFEDDAEYYLAMAYLSNNESQKAMPIFEKIKSDPENRHYEDVSNWFMLNVRTLIAKK
jgi:tetratricopeptide (TPR) repeat protein